MATGFITQPKPARDTTDPPPSMSGLYLVDICETVTLSLLLPQILWQVLHDLMAHTTMERFVSKLQFTIYHCSPEVSRIKCLVLPIKIDIYDARSNGGDIQTLLSTTAEGTQVCKI